MARKKSSGGQTGAPAWFVTFADLMALLMSFFVILAAYSTQDQRKMQIVAGSIRDAFGVNPESRLSGIIEKDGLPTLPEMQNVEQVRPEEASDHTVPNDLDRREKRAVLGDLRSRLRAGGRLAAPGAAGHARDRGALAQSRHRGDRRGTRRLARRPGRALDVPGGLGLPLRSARGSSWRRWRPSSAACPTASR